MDVVDLLVIFLTGLGSSLFGTLVGGSRLITIPVLILLGLPPHSAIGTDRMGVTGLGIAGLYSFHKQGLVRYKIGFIVGIPCLLGSFIGANLALQISPLRTGDCVMGLFFSLLVGVYGGFYGAGASTFLSYTMILVFRQTFLESAATLKVGAILMTATSALTYAYHGAIHYPLAVALFAGSSMGSFAGAHYSENCMLEKRGGFICRTGRDAGPAFFTFEAAIRHVP